jgi:hypothetical protein
MVLPFVVLHIYGLRFTTSITSKAFWSMFTTFEPPLINLYLLFQFMSLLLILCYHVLIYIVLIFCGLMMEIIYIYNYQNLLFHPNVLK